MRRVKRNFAFAKDFVDVIEPIPSDSWMALDII
jgi:hypothetical protein